MKRLLAVLALVALAVAVCGVAALAEEDYDYSVEGWYRVYSITPEDHDYSYIYDKPSSSKGKNLGRVDDYDYVYVEYKTEGQGKKSSEWAYCEFEDIEGYVRFENLIYDPAYVFNEEDVEGWYVVSTILPEDHDYSYIYDQPSSTLGKNLGQVDDGESVYVYSVELGTGRRNSRWAYCDYDGIRGYVRYRNLIPESE